MFSKIVTSTSEVGTGGCASQSTSPRFPCHGGFSGVFPIICVLYLNDLPSEALSSTYLVLSL